MTAGQVGVRYAQTLHGPAVPAAVPAPSYNDTGRTCGSGCDGMPSVPSWKTWRSLPWGDGGGAGSAVAMANGTGGGGAGGRTAAACAWPVAKVPMLHTTSWPPDMRNSTWGTFCTRPRMEQISRPGGRWRLRAGHAERSD